MIKLRLAVAAVFASVLFALSAGTALAATDPYPVATPTPTPSISPAEAVEGEVSPAEAVDAQSGEVSPADTNGLLPNTGGVSFYILLIGGVLVVVGGGVAYTSHRRSVTH